MKSLQWMVGMVLLSGLLLTAGAGLAEWDPLTEDVEPSRCLAHLQTPHTDAFLQKELFQFQSLSEQALMLRAETIKVARELKRKADADLPLSGADLDLLGKGLAYHLDLRKQLLQMAESHECWLNLEPDELTKYGLNPNRHLQGVMVSLASALVMYDNYLYTTAMFQADPKLRYLLNSGDRGYQVDKAELMKVTLSYNSIQNRARVRRAMKHYEKAVVQPGVSPDPYLRALIEQSPSYDMVREWSPLRVAAQKLGFLENLTTDSFKILEREGVGLFSMLFGNTVGLVETRKGKLYRQQKVEDGLGEVLQSGDILLEKTPFRLTDKLIPGYWGHAAVWLGTEAELKELGVWDHPVVRRHHKAIREGRLVVEALRSGVEMNPLEKFLNIDSIGVLRRPGLTREQRKQVVLQTLRQVGKPYDFNFDVETLDRVYCSKLVYLAYHGVNWPVQESFGRKTISPDDVAVRAFSRNDLELISFYHDGKPVTRKPVATMATLMGVAERK